LARDITRWKDRYNSAILELKKDEGKRKKCIERYNGNHWDGKTVTTYTDQVTKNFVKTLVDTIMDSVYFRNPQFLFDADNAQFDLIAKVLNQIFPKILTKLQYKKMTKKCVFDALQVGLGWKYNGYTLSGDKTNDAIQPDEVYSIWVPQDSVAIDPDAHGSWDANYIFMHVDVGLDEAKRHPAYAIPKDFTSVTQRADSDEVKYRDERDKNTLRLIHCFDRGEGKHKIFTQELKSYVYEADWPIGLNYFPLHELKFYENGLYPPGVINDVIPLNDEINKMASMLLTHAKRFNRKYHIKGETLDPDATRNLKSGVDGALVQTTEDIEIKPIEDAQLDPNVYRNEVDLWDTIKLMTRIGDFSFGKRPPGEMTATEANYIEGGTSLGIGSMRDTIGDFCTRDAEILIALMERNYDSERYFKYSDNGAASQVTFSRASLKDAKFNIEIDCEGTAPPERAEERNEAMAVMETFQNDPYVDPIKLRETFIKTFKTIPQSAALLNSPATMQIIAQVMNGGGKEANLSAIQSHLAKGTNILTAGKYAPT